MEVKPGSQSTEFKLTVAAIIVGLVLEGSVIPVLEYLKSVGIDSPLIGVALAVSGVLIQIASLFGYNKGRALVKAESIRQQGFAAQAAEQAAASLAVAKVHAEAQSALNAPPPLNPQG